MKQNAVDAENPLRFNSILPLNQELYIISLYEKALFRTQRKAVEAGAHGTLDYTIKEGVNKNKIADEKILKSKK